jgi:hypothetical protein
MRQVRTGVFETNSSSMHSLVIKKESAYFTEDEVRKDIYINKDGLINLYHRDMYFGRSPFQVLTSLKDKALYTLASMCNSKDSECYKEVCDVIQSYIPEFKDFDLEFTSSTHAEKYYTEDDMKQYYGEGNYLKSDKYWITWGYDFGSVDEDILSHFLREENITITEFLKNKRYVVIVDGDEYCIYKDMKKNRLIDTNNIEREYTLGDWIGDE